MHFINCLKLDYCIGELVTFAYPNYQVASSLSFFAADSKDLNAFFYVKNMNFEKHFLLGLVPA